MKAKKTSKKALRDAFQIIRRGLIEANLPLTSVSDDLDDVATALHVKLPNMLSVVRSLRK